MTVNNSTSAYKIPIVTAPTCGMPFKVSLSNSKGEEWFANIYRIHEGVLQRLSVSFNPVWEDKPTPLLFSATMSLFIEGKEYVGDKPDTQPLGQQERLTAVDKPPTDGSNYFAVWSSGSFDIHSDLFKTKGSITSVWRENKWVVSKMIDKDTTHPNCSVLYFVTPSSPSTVEELTQAIISGKFIVRNDGEKYRLRHFNGETKIYNVKGDRFPINFETIINNPKEFSVE